MAHPSQDAGQSCDNLSTPDSPTQQVSPSQVDADTPSFSMDRAADSGITPATSEQLPAELVNHPRYVLLEKLGEGGMGTVYKARHRLMDRFVALKVIRGPLGEQPAMVARFEREIRAAHLSHPNIVMAYDAETSGALHFLVMEYVKGINLADVIAREGTLPVTRACDCARQAALGLQYAFSRGMVHRDIKPHNLIRTVAEDGKTEVVKILDFGLARFIQEAQAPAAEGVSDPSAPKARPSPGEQAGSQTASATLVGTAPGSLLGTSNYMAPEQANDPRNADIRADIYSLGCTLYHLLTGRPPFGGLPEADKLEAHRHLTPRPVGACRADVPAELECVVARMMAKDPAQRYQTPAEVAAALTPFATAPPSPPAASAVECPAPPLTCWRRRSCILALGLLVGAAVGTGGLILFRYFFPGHPSSSPRPDDAQPEQQGNVPLVRTAELLFEGHTAQVSGVAYSRDGQLLLSGSFDTTLRSWNVRTGRNLHVFRGHSDRVRGIALSPDGRRALSASDDKTVRVWDVASGRQVGCFPGHVQPVACVAFSPDGKYALSGSGKGRVRFWEVATVKEVWSVPGGAESVAFSPDGRQAVSGGWDNTVDLWDVASGQKVRVLKGHEGGVKSVCFSPDGQHILSGSEDRTVGLWDAARGTMVHRWPAHKGLIWGVTFSRDGRRFLSAGLDRTARVWDVATGRALQLFEPDVEEILCGAISPDGRDAVCGCADGIIRLWKLPR